MENVSHAKEWFILRLKSSKTSHMVDTNFEGCFLSSSESCELFMSLQVDSLVIAE